MTRENGHYWVKVVRPPWNPDYVGEWTVAQWDDDEWIIGGDWLPDGPYMRVVEDRLVLPCAAARMDLVDEEESQKLQPEGTVTINSLNPPMDPVQPDGQ